MELLSDFDKIFFSLFLLSGISLGNEVFAIIVHEYTIPAIVIAAHVV